MPTGLPPITIFFMLPSGRSATGKEALLSDGDHHVFSVGQIYRIPAKPDNTAAPAAQSPIRTLIVVVRKFRRDTSSIKFNSFYPLPWLMSLNSVSLPTSGPAS